jgi:hypothetical protein
LLEGSSTSSPTTSTGLISPIPSGRTW